MKLWNFLFLAMLWMPLYSIRLNRRDHDEMLYEALGGATDILTTSETPAKSESIAVLFDFLSKQRNVLQASLNQLKVASEKLRHASLKFVRPLKLHAFFPKTPSLRSPAGDKVVNDACALIWNSYDSGVATRISDKISTSFHSSCTTEQINKIQSVIENLFYGDNSNQSSTDSKNHSKAIQDQALCAGWWLDQQLVQRFLMAASWQDHYHGRSIEDAIRHAIDLRCRHHMSRVNSSHPRALAASNQSTGYDNYTTPMYLPLSLIEHGASYCNRVDKYGRPIVYLKLGKFRKQESYERDDYIYSMLYTLERADSIINSYFADESRRLPCSKLKGRSATLNEHKSFGKFVAIIDMTNASYFSSPGIGVVLDAVELIKYSYPNRLDSLYIINSGLLFKTVWQVIKPTLSKTSMEKVIFISSLEEAQITLPKELGHENIETTYGGEIAENFSASVYFNSWVK